MNGKLYILFKIFDLFGINNKDIISRILTNLKVIVVVSEIDNRAVIRKSRKKKTWRQRVDRNKEARRAGKAEEQRDCPHKSFTNRRGTASLHLFALYSVYAISDSSAPRSLHPACKLTSKS